MASLYVDGKEYPLRETSRVVGKLTRGFEYKLQMESIGGRKYESRGFFCSFSGECEARDAEAVANDLQQFCEDRVLESVRDYTAKFRKQLEKKVLKIGR